MINRVICCSNNVHNIVVGLFSKNFFQIKKTWLEQQQKQPPPKMAVTKVMAYSYNIGLFQLLTSIRFNVNSNRICGNDGFFIIDYSYFAIENALHRLEWATGTKLQTQFRNYFLFASHLYLILKF